MDVTAVIAAGGRGRRMGGRNKALLEWDGETFVARQIRLCRECTDDIVVVANDPSFASQLRREFGVSATADRFPGEGPLAALHAGISAARYPAVWLLACDMPLPSREAAALLLGKLGESDAVAAVPLAQGLPQTLHAVYRRETAIMAEQLLAKGEKRMNALLDRIPWIGVDMEQFAVHGIAPDFTEDIDTPEDFERVRRLASGHGDRKERDR